MYAYMYTQRAMSAKQEYILIQHASYEVLLLHLFLLQSLL